MDNYNTSMTLLGLNDQNLPPFKEARLRRYQSTRKMINLIEVSTSLAPRIPIEAFNLDPYDPEWDDDMTYPVIQYHKFIWQAGFFACNLFFYAYNYNNLTANVRLRSMRYLFPAVNLLIFTNVYADYRQQLMKVNLFDEFVQLRSKELVDQNEYLFQHEDFKRYVWWFEDLKETLCRVHRQANNHDSQDFQDSELILQVKYQYFQDFIRRYSAKKLLNLQ